MGQRAVLMDYIGRQPIRLSMSPQSITISYGIAVVGINRVDLNVGAHGNTSNKAKAVLLRYRPTADSAIKARHHHAALRYIFCHYSIVSAHSRYNVQIAATSKFAISGSILRMCRLPADTGHPESGCIPHCIGWQPIPQDLYWPPANTTHTAAT
jgi:hypothetical protein